MLYAVPIGARNQAPAWLQRTQTVAASIAVRLTVRCKREEARRAVFESIEVFYKRMRRHANIDKQVPADFANQYYADTLGAAA